MERPRATIPDNPLALPVDEQFVQNKDFHSVVLETAGNTPLVIAAQPLFSILQTNLARSVLSPEFHRGIHEDHEPHLAWSGR